MINANSQLECQAVHFVLALVLVLAQADQGGYSWLQQLGRDNVL